MTHEDQKQLVALGYDKIADDYIDRFGRSSVRTAKLAELIASIAPAASILDLGCGAGIPVARDLVALGFKVTGVDLSSGQIERARRNVPEAEFHHSPSEIGARRPDPTHCKMASAWRLFPGKLRNRRGRLVGGVAGNNHVL
jgi:SAM-dependent methyltransferase